MAKAEESTAESAATTSVAEAERIWTAWRALLPLGLRLVLACTAIAVGRAVEAQTALDSLSPRTLVGCYALSLTRESGAPPTRWLQQQIPPAHFRLDTVRVTHGFTGFVVQPPFLAEPPRRMPVPAVWNVIARDSIRIAWSTGYVGAEVELRVRGDTLIGRAVPFQDARFFGDPPPPVASAVAIRTPCSP